VIPFSTFLEEGSLSQGAVTY